MENYTPLTNEERAIRNAIEADKDKVVLANYYDKANRLVYRAVESENVIGHNKVTYQKWVEYNNPRKPDDARVKITYEDVFEEE